MTLQSILFHIYLYKITRLCCPRFHEIHALGFGYAKKFPPSLRCQWPPALDPCVRWVTSADLELVINNASFVVVKKVLLFSPIFRYTTQKTALRLIEDIALHSIVLQCTWIYRYTSFVLNLGRHIPRSSMILCRLIH